MYSFGFQAPTGEFEGYNGIMDHVFKSIKFLKKGNAAEADNSFTSRGDNFSKTSALCDTVTNQSAKDLCETLLS